MEAEWISVSDWPSVQEAYMQEKVEVVCLVENGFDECLVENGFDECLVENDFDEFLVENYFVAQTPDAEVFVPTPPDSPQTNVLPACSREIDADIDVKSVEVADSMEGWVSDEGCQAAKECLMSGSPTSFTRYRYPDLARPALTAISDRMKHYKQQRHTDDSECEPATSSPRLPRTRGNLSAGPSSSPKRNKRTQEQQRNKLYPNLNLQKHTTNIYPNLPDDDDGDHDSEDDNLRNEDDSGENCYDKPDSEKKVKTPTSSSVKQGAKNKPRNAVDSPHMIGESRPRKDNISFEGHPAQTQNYVISCMVVAVVVLAVVTMVYMKQEHADDLQPTSSPVDYFKVYKPHLDQIRAKYPSQNSRFWRIVSSSIRRLLTGGIDTYPAVLLFGIPKVHSQTGTCISKDIIKSLNEVFNGTNDGYINLENLNSKTPEKMKLDLDGQLIENLDNSKGVVLDHLERLPAHVALLLHGYCDGDNAPYKSAAIILGLHTDKPLSDHDDIIEAILNDLWEGELGVDEMPALRSRIANSATVVNPETDIAC